MVEIVAIVVEASDRATAQLFVRMGIVTHRHMLSRFQMHASFCATRRPDLIFVIRVMIARDGKQQHMEQCFKGRVIHYKVQYLFSKMYGDNKR